jgi:hypothetical protein
VTLFSASIENSLTLERSAGSVIFRGRPTGFGIILLATPADTDEEKVRSGADEERALSIVTDGIRAVVAVAGVVAVTVGVARWFDESVFTTIPAVAPGEFMLLGTFLLLSIGLPFKGVERRSVEQSALRWILMLLAWSGCQATILLPFRGSDRPGQEIARSIEAVVPLQQQLWHDVSGRWNTLAQVERTLKIVSKQVQPVPGDWFLTMETQQPQLQDGWKTIELSDGTPASIGIHQRRVPTNGKEK